MAVQAERIDGSLPIGQDQRIEQKARLIFQRSIGIEHVALRGLYSTDARRNEARHGAFSEQGSMKLRDRAAFHTRSQQDGNFACLDRAIARPGHQ